MDIMTANTILYCRNWQKTVDFYKNGLGLDVGFENDWFVEFIINSSARLSIADENRSSVKSSEGKGITIAFQIEDIGAVHENLLKNGLEPLPVKSHAWNAQVFHVSDPEGNRVEFWMINR